MPKKILNLDEMLDDEPAEPVHTRPFRLFGRDWTLVCDMNAFAVAEMMTGDAGGIVRFIDSLILEEERIAFRTALASKPLSAERLNKIMDKMIEAAVEPHPTTPPSASSRTGRNQTSVRKSAAGSSRKPAGR